MSIALSDESLALVQAAHADPDLEKLSKAYEAMELIGKSHRPFRSDAWQACPSLLLTFPLPLATLETQIWITKHVRPDESYFVANNTGPAGLGKGTKLDFTWGWGPISINAILDLLQLYIEADVSVNTYILGVKKVLVLKGNLKDGVEGSFDIGLASGSVKLSLRNLREVWAQLEVSSPLFAKVEQELMITKICVLTAIYRIVVNDASVWTECAEEWQMDE